MKKQDWHPPAMLALLAVLLILGAWTGFGIRMGADHLLSYPFALPGAHGLPGAVVFNLLVFVLPGGLMVVLADSLRRRLPARTDREQELELADWLLRIGCGLALLAALAWIAQGLFPLDTTTRLDLEGSDSTFFLVDPNVGNSRWHVSAWMVWQLAVTSAALFMAVVVPELRGYGAALLVVILMPGLLSTTGTWVIRWAELLAVLLWGVWMWEAMKALTKSAAIRSR